MRTILIGILLILTLGGQCQELQYRSVEYYFNQIAELEIRGLIDQKVLLDSVTIADNYLDKETNGLNKEGFFLYVDTKIKIYESFFKDYLYQQHVYYDDHVYVLYFSVAGLDDAEWNIVKWNKKDWKNEEKLSRERLKSDSSLSLLFWNYDEGPKNMENIRLFVENNYLVFERGNLYHSLYDLKTDSVLFNEVSPWYASNAEDKEKMNEWIKLNLHDKIVGKLNERRK